MVGQPVTPHAAPVDEPSQESLREACRAVITVVAPEELPILEGVAKEYVDDPASTLRGRQRDEPVGFGLELALITPFALDALLTSARWIAEATGRGVQAEFGTQVASILRRLTQRGSEHQDGHAVNPSKAELTQLRGLIHERSVALGLDETRAEILGESIVGLLATTRRPSTPGP